MRNTRLPVSLNDTTCTITDTASSTNSPPMIARATSCLVATATVPSMPPSASEPVRSEEHTSELQSPCNLVCRLLLEKKKEQHYPLVAAYRAAILLLLYDLLARASTDDLPSRPTRQQRSDQSGHTACPISPPLCQPRL